jgi:hypothetical protein
LAFLDRLPNFIADVTRRLDARLDETSNAEAQVEAGRRQLASLAKAHTSGSIRARSGYGRDRLTAGPLRPGSS